MIKPSDYHLCTYLKHGLVYDLDSSNAKDLAFAFARLAYNIIHNI